MKEIKLTQNQVTLVDNEDFEHLNQWKWCAVKVKNTFYAIRNVGKFPHRSTMWMHREIMNCPDNMFVDHADMNGLNNQKTNLRICTKSENQRNRGKTSNKSGYKGVYWHKGHNKFMVVVVVDGERYHLGYFENEIDAAKVYDAKAKELHGEFARLNFE